MNVCVRASVCSATRQSDYPTGPNELKRRAPNLLSFKGVPSPPSWCFRGYFHPLFINLLSLCITSCQPFTSHEWRLRILFWMYLDFDCSVKCNAHGFSQCCNFQNQKITMLENVGFITELIAWHISKVTWVVPVSDEGETVPTFSGWRIVQSFRK